MTDEIEATGSAPAGEPNLRDVLMAIRAKRGMLTREVVVQEAMDPAHPLHGRFTWDDSEAAHQWRLHEAGQLLRVTYKQDVGEDRVDLRAFWVVRTEKGAPTSVYEPTEEVALDPIQRELMLRQMRREWLSFKRRYHHMAEFVGEIQAALDAERESAS